MVHSNKEARKRLAQMHFRNNRFTFEKISPPPLSFFLFWPGFRKPNLITGLSGWREHLQHVAYPRAEASLMGPAGRIWPDDFF